MAAATGNVTNQAVQFQNNGAPSRQYFANNVSCNGATMQFSPFYMGNDTVPYEHTGYVRSNNWGVQLNFSVPLDSGMIELCKNIAKKGAPSRQYFANNVSCNGATMQFSPFYMGNDTVPYEHTGYVRSNNWGVQLNFSVPLDSGMIELCKNIAKKHEQKLRLDYELVRALKCTEIMKAGFQFRPGSRVEVLCHDVVPIVAVNDKEESD